MAFKTVYCTDSSCRSIRIIETDGDVLFSILSPSDPTYLNLMRYCEIPFPYIPVSQFFCDPRIITRGRILSTADFLAQCNPQTGDLLNPLPNRTQSWVAAYQPNGSDNYIAYTEDYQKLTLDPIDDIALYTELENYSDFLFGGKILTEYEAELYNIENIYFSFVSNQEAEETLSIEIDIDDTVPFILDQGSNVKQKVDTGFIDFLQLSEAWVNQYYNANSNPEPITPYLVRDTRLSDIYQEWFDDNSLDNIQEITTKLDKIID